MSNNKTVALVITLLAGLLLGAATLTAAQNSPETLTIGFIGAGTGRQAQQDQLLYQAAVLAAETINSAEDNHLADPDGTRYTLRVVYYDADTGDDAVSALDSAVVDDAIAVLGPQQPELAQAILDAGTPAIPLLLGGPDAPRGTSYVFDLSAGYAPWAQAAADYLVQQRHFNRVALVAANTDVALSSMDAFRAAVDADFIVADLTHDAGDDDFTTEARTLRDADAQALFVWTLDSSMVALLRALDAVNWSGMIVYAGLDAEFLTRADDLIPADFFGTTAWTAAAYDAASQSFVADYTARWGQMPPDGAAAYYDAVYLLADAIRSDGAAPPALNTALNTMTDIAGVQGSYAAAQTDALLLVQAYPDGTLIEAARYAGGTCQTCPNLWLADTTNEAAETVVTYNIGLIASLDGPAEASGESIEQAARLAVREINELGGVLDTDGRRYTLNLRVYSATNQTEAASAFNQAVADGMQIIIGPDWNAHVLPNLYRAEAAGVVQLVSATDTRIASDEPTNFVFQLRATDDAKALALADYLLNGRDYTQLASVAVRADYALSAANTFADVVASSEDGELALRLEHDIDAGDYSEIARQITAADVEAVVVWSTQPAASSLLAELNALGWDGLFAYGYLNSEFVYDDAAPDSVELIGAVNWTAASGDWVSRDFTARYTERYGSTPTAQSAAYYDAVYLLASGLAQVGAENIQSWLIELERFVGVQGVYTPAAFANGELLRGVVIVRVQEQGMVEIARYNGAECLVYCE